MWSNFQSDLLIISIQTNKQTTLRQLNIASISLQVKQTNCTQTPVTALWFLPGGGTARYAGEWIVSLVRRKEEKQQKPTTSVRAIDGESHRDSATR